MIKIHRPYVYPNLVLTIGRLDVEYHDIDGDRQILIGWGGEAVRIFHLRGQHIRVSQ